MEKKLQAPWDVGDTYIQADDHIQVVKGVWSFCVIDYASLSGDERLTNVSPSEGCPKGDLSFGNIL